MNLSAQHIESIKKYLTDRPVTKAYLFGSYSRNEANGDSDVDILVELDHSKPIGLKFFTYSEELAHILNKKVDLVTYDGLSKYIKPIVDRDKILIYEK